MKNLLQKILLSATLWCSSCYQSIGLMLPREYKSIEGSPYVCERDEKRNINYYTFRSTRHLIGEVKGDIPKLMEAVDEAEKKKPINPLEVVLLGKAHFKIFKKNTYLTNDTVGFYDIKFGCIGLRDYLDGFAEKEQKTFIHEYIHLLDNQDGSTSLTEKEVERKTKEISERLGL